jgi:tetratricopeptide (TPR) repeat protein
MIPSLRRRALALGVLLGLGFVALAAAATSPAGPATPTASPRPVAKAPAAKPAAGSARALADQAREARELEDMGAYARAATILRTLRSRVAEDADLELAIALDDARLGRVDSAWARLTSPLVTAAAQETLPVTRRHEYPYGRERGWLNGRFDGWHWYVWRARAEVAATTGRWDEAYEAARQCAAARPLTGKEWLILAVCAGRLGRDDEARETVRKALALDPTLPEARYLLGLWEWRAGRRAEAQTQFREAVALDSAFVPAAMAMVRSRLPGAKPDSLPREFLTGPRRVALLTAPERPKPEEFVQMDVSATLTQSPDTAVVDSLVPGVKPLQLVLSVLVDERGRPVLNDIPWFPPGQIPEWKIHRLLASVPSWRFKPAMRLGAPHPVWLSLDFYFNP